MSYKFSQGQNINVPLLAYSKVYLQKVKLNHLFYFLFPAGVRAADSDDEEQVNEDEAEDPQGAAAQAAGAPGLCKVMEQKEGEDGLVDAHCGAVTPPGYGGLCK